MFLGEGSGDYTAGIYHMIMHAFFKALLFLAAGSVIHALHDEQNMKKMGGLRKYLPVTYPTFIIGYLALAGIPPFDGFWSKEDILDSAWHMSPALWAIGAFTAGLTAYYMSRQVALVWLGQARWKEARPGADGAEQGAEAHGSTPDRVRRRRPSTQAAVGRPGRRLSRPRRSTAARATSAATPTNRHG